MSGPVRLEAGAQAQPAARTQPFVVMAKPVGSRCNMRCTYCYYLDKGRYSSHARQTRMRYSLLEKLIRQTIASSKGPVVSFTWHGGEPTLAGLEFYQHVVALQRKYLPQGWTAWNNLQTNGLLLTDKWCRFLKEHRFDVGLSMDGGAYVHDQNRRDGNGEGTYARVRRAVDRLQAVGIQPDLLCTVNAASLQDPLDVYRSLRELGTGWMQFIPIVVRRQDGGLTPQSVTAAGYGAFLCTVFDEWIAHDLGALDVQLFAETARVWAGGQASLCWMAPTCGRVLIAEEDGSVYACDHFVDPAHRLGNLADTPLEQMANSPQQLAFGDGKRDALTQQCRRCPWLACCNGGCPKDRFGVSEDGEAGHFLLCDGLRRFFAHAHGPMMQAMAWSRQGLTPAQVMARLKAQHTAGDGALGPSS